MKLFEAIFSFTPDDDSAGEGLVTVSAETVEEAKTFLLDFLADVPGLLITEIREAVELPETIEFIPRTLN